MPAKRFADANYVRVPFTSGGRSANKLAINEHTIEACNYTFQFSYAYWQNRSGPLELWHDHRISQQLLDSLFQISLIANPFEHTCQTQTAAIDDSDLYSQVPLKQGPEIALSELHFIPSRFSSRYTDTIMEGLHESI
jgi:hypothetical protein